jgi:hypothetical protein
MTNPYLPPESAPPTRLAAVARGKYQIVLALLMAGYFCLAALYVPSIYLLVNTGSIAPFAALLWLLGSLFLVIGIGRHVHNPIQGKVLLVLSALLLVLSASKIGNWNTSFGGQVGSVVALGSVVAMLGLWGIRSATRKGHK